MKLALKYGKQILDIELPSAAVHLKVSEPEYSIDKTEFCKELISALPSNEEAFRNIAIVVADKTRLCGYTEFLPWIVESLLEKGVTKKQITFYIAYGTHPPQSEQESLNSYGDIFKEFTFIQHNSRDIEAFIELGITKHGTSITIRKDILASTLIITFGAISHHYFAGYGGGRKLLFPGLAKREAIYKNHSLFLNIAKRELSAGCQPGNLKGNPLAEDLQEIDSYMPPKISIHGIINVNGKVCQLYIGKTYEDFVTSCRVHDSYYRSGTSDLFDLVVASSGGYPKDINFIQAHKSVHHAAAFVKDGGKLVILSECVDGIASDYFLKYLEAGGFDEAFTMLEKNYEGNGGTALSMMTKTKRITIYMVTALSEELCKTLNVKKIKQSDVQSIINAENGSIAVIQNASILVR